MNAYLQLKLFSPVNSLHLPCSVKLKACVPPPPCCATASAGRPARVKVNIDIFPHVNLGNSKLTSIIRRLESIVQAALINSFLNTKRPPLTWQPCVLVDAFHLVDRKVILFGQLQELGQGLAGTVLADEQLTHSSFRVEGATTNKRRGVGTVGATSGNGVICGNFPLQFIVGNVQACAGFLRQVAGPAARCELTHQRLPESGLWAVCRYILDKELSFAVELDFFNTSAEIKGLNAGALSDEAEPAAAKGRFRFALILARPALELFKEVCQLLLRTVDV